MSADRSLSDPRLVRGLARRVEALGASYAQMSRGLGVRSFLGFFAPLLAVVGVLNAVIGAYYYLRVIVHMWMKDPETDELFPHVLRELRRRLTVALRRAFFDFARRSTTHRPDHFHALGRRAVVKAVWAVDRQLAAVSNQFDYLLQLTPVNGEQAWQEFRRHRFERKPVFTYRPLPAEPVVLKRNLYKAPV